MEEEEEAFGTAELLDTEEDPPTEEEGPEEVDGMMTKVKVPWEIKHYNSFT